MPIFHHVYARHLKASTEWYAVLLGQMPSRDAAGVRFATRTETLLLSTHGEPARFSVHVDLIDAARLRLQLLDLPTGEVVDQPHDSAESVVWFTDPAGNGVRLAQEPEA